MRRRLLNLLTALSLLLCVAVVMLWVRSYFTGEIFHLPPGGVVDTTASAPMQGGTLTWRRQYSVHSGAGRLQLVRRELQDTSVNKPGRVVLGPREAVTDLSSMSPGDVSYRGGGGFGYFRRDKQPYTRPPVNGWYWGFLVVSVPYWAMALAAAAVPLVWWWSFVQRRRRRLREQARLCPACGYDLRATPDKCPECGATTSAAASGAAGSTS